jgi:hypothetical protein
MDRQRASTARAIPRPFLFPLAALAECKIGSSPKSFIPWANNTTKLKSVVAAQRT